MVELLSPAGNFEKLKVALAYGADVVYGGVSQFSLRARSGKEFDFDTFAKAVRYTHNLGKKIFVTINGFPFNSQIKLLEAHIEKMASLNPDAFIIATPGVLKLAKKIAPHIPIHLSTQANVLNVLDASVFYEMGAKRIVAARELSLNDAREIKKALPNLEIEIFIHGSMCFSFSGRCLISALQNGRVPNRGSCANDCRFDYEYFVRDTRSDELVPFNGNEFYVKAPDNSTLMRIEETAGVGSHIFNAKDLNLASHMKEILSSGAVDALKIEGRTKSTYYAAITAKTYRSAIDDFYAGRLDNAKILDYQAELHTLKNRGFTDGYIVHRPYEKFDTQNFQTAISNGDFQVSAFVARDSKGADSENGENVLEFSQSCDLALCKFTITPDSVNEIVAPPNSVIKCAKNDIGEVFEQGGKFFVRFKRIILENGKELDSIHSGNTNLFRLPTALPTFSFLRRKC